MKTRIQVRKRTAISWIEQKFGSLETLANLAGINTSHAEVRNLLKQIRTSRDPVVVRIQYRNSVIEVGIEHHESKKLVAEKTVGPVEIPDYSTLEGDNENE